MNVRHHGKLLRMKRRSQSEQNFTWLNSAKDKNPSPSASTCGRRVMMLRRRGDDTGTMCVKKRNWRENEVDLAEQTVHLEVGLRAARHQNEANMATMLP
jgi:hypothetical protein